MTDLKMRSLSEDFNSYVELIIDSRLNELSPEQVKFIIKDSGSKIIIFGKEFKELVEKLNADKTDLHLSFGISELRNLLKSKSPGAFDVSLSVNKATKTPLFQMYTSGTTGNPKGVVYTPVSYTHLTLPTSDLV